MKILSFTDVPAKPSLGTKEVFIPATLRVDGKDKPVTIRTNDDGSFFVPVKDRTDRSARYYLKFRCTKLKSQLEDLIGNTDVAFRCKCYALSKKGDTGYCGFDL